MAKLRVLDLFSGIGGFSLGLERTRGFETAAFCEYAEFPRKVLAKHWPDVPIYPDVRELTAERLDADGIGRIDLICGGYPCQPFSHAGKRLGAEDDRHLWPEMRRLIAALRPAWVIGENVAGHISMGLDDVLSDLDGLGYSAQAFVIPACAVNAPHRRDRVWLVACASDMQRNGGNDLAGKRMGREQVSQPRNGGWPQDVADTGCELREQGGGSEPQRDKTSFWNQEAANDQQRCEDVADPRRSGLLWGEWFSDNDGETGGWWQTASGSVAECRADGGRPSNQWDAEPAVGRVAHGVPHRVDRLKALGNAVVPQIPEMLGRAILQSLGEAA